MYSALGSWCSRVYLLTILFFLTALSSAPAQAEIFVRSGELIVKLKEQNGPSAEAASIAGASSIKTLGKRKGSPFRKLKIGAALQSEATGSAAIVPYNAADYAATCAELKAKGIAETCGPNFIYKADATPSDPSYAAVDGMQRINAPAAWDLTTGSQSVIVGINDSGIDYTHPDLVDNMWVNPGEIANNGFDDDGNGYIDDVYGVNAINDSGDPYDDNEHGSHVAGTVGATGNNGVGVVGVNWHVRLMGLKFLGADGSGSTEDAIEAIQYGIDNGVQVINASWGGGGYDDNLYDVLREAGQHGILFVAAAGNEGADSDYDPHYPSSYELDNIIAVAAADDNDALAEFSNYGYTSVDIAAPGTSVLSTVPGGGYEYFDGTSMASPHVAGLAALILSYKPGLTATQLKSIIIDNGDSVDALAGVTKSGRRINALAALLASGVGYSLSVGSYNSTTAEYVPNAKLQKNYLVQLGISGVETAQVLDLKLKIRNKTCNVGSYAVDPSGATSLFGVTLPYIKGNGIFKLYNSSGSVVAQASAKYAPKNNYLRFTDFANPTSLCRRYAKKVTAP